MRGIVRGPARAGDMRPFTLTLLGGFEARLATGSALTLPTKKTQALLAYLALRPGQALSRDRLAGLLWGDTADARARKSLRQAMYILRKALPATQPPSLLIEGEKIALNPEVVDIDAAVFEQLLTEGTPAALERAVALYRGDLLDGLSVNEASFEEWLVTERERLRELALEGFAKLLAHQSKAGQTEPSIQTAARLLALDPSQEVVHRTLMRLYARQGRRSAALKQYQVCVAALQRELGTEPEPETKQLYHDILQRRQSEPLETRTHRAHEAPRTPRASCVEPIARDAPLIGRELELARLRDALDHASRGRGHVVAIMGEAGIGKSSLLKAFAAEGNARGSRILLGRSYQTEQVLAFGPWVDALRSGHVAADVAALDSLKPLWRAELARLLAELAVTGGEPVSHARDHRRLFDAVTELVRSLAAKAPVLVMLEDVHWADEMTLRLAAFLARRIRTSPVLLVVTIRDEELASAPDLRLVLDELSRESHFSPLLLAPLTRADTMGLVDLLTNEAVGAGDTGRLGEQIWHASQGNPFMVVETIRALHEGTSPGAAAALPLPERVRAVIAGRLDRLGDRDRHLVSVAAVIGREFEFALLHRAAGLDERETVGAVEELVRRRVLHGVGGRFDFTHDRIREVAYRQLLQPRRKILHLLVANALEGLNAGSLTLPHAALAGHYHAAEVWERALTHFRQAGAEAMRLSAYREAMTCFEQALEALAHLPETRETLETGIDLRLDLRHALHPLGEGDRIRESLRDAEGLARKLDDRRRLGWISAYMAHYFRMAGHSTEAVRLARTAQRLGETLGDSFLRPRADLHLGTAYLSLGDYRRAEDLLRRVVQSLDDDRSRGSAGHEGFPAVLARAYRAQSLAELGQFKEGVVCGEEGIWIAEALDHPMSLASVCSRLGHLHAVKGELDRAAVLLERGRALTRDWEITFTAALVTGSLGYVYVLLGRVAEGLGLLRDAIDAYESMRVEAVKARLLVHLGEAYLLTGRLGDADVCAARSLAHTRERGERGQEAHALRLLGEIAAHRDPLDVEAAEDRYREAMTLAAELGMRPLIARCHHGLGTLYRRAGETHIAREHLAAAETLFSQMEMKSWLAKAAAELAALR